MWRNDENEYFSLLCQDVAAAFKPVLQQHKA